MDIQDVRDFLESGKPEAARLALVMVLVHHLTYGYDNFGTLTHVAYDLDLVDSARESELDQWYKDISS